MKTGLSSCGKELNEALFREMSECGISCLELSLGADENYDIDLKPVKELADRYSVRLWSCHLPFGGRLNPASLNEEERAYTVERFRRIISSGAESGIGIFVMHLSCEPIRDEDRPAAMINMKRSLAELARHARALAVTIAVEDLPRSCLGNCSDEILEALSVDESLRVCFDTNHLLKQTDEDFVRAVGRYIVTTHISDFDFFNERHWLPGEGDLNWQSIYGSLKDAGYDGPWLYELGFEAPKTIDRPRNLTVRDFADNAKAIFEGRAPQAIGVRKPKLGMWGPIE